MGNIPLKVVADFYDASLDAARWPQALLALGEWAKAEAVGLLVHNFEDGSGRFERAVGIGAEVQAGYRRTHSRANPWLQSDAPFRNGTLVVRGSDVVGFNAIKASSFYRNWLRSTGLLHHLFALIDRQGSSVTMLVLARREGKADFGEDTVQGLQSLVPTLGRAMGAGAGVRQLRSLERAVLREMDALPIGAVILDRNGGVIEANPFARAVIDAAAGMYMLDGVLAADVGSRRLKLRELIGRSADRTVRVTTDDVSMLSVPRQASQRPLTLLLVPLEQTDDESRGPAALLFVGDSERPVRFDHNRIARLYGLSRAESRVAALLAGGYRLEQVADSLGIAYETVRKHLKQIFGKTGTYRQAELVRVLVTGPAGLSI